MFNKSKSFYALQSYSQIQKKKNCLFFLIILFLISLSHGAEQILNAFFGVSIELELCNNILYYYFKILQV